MKLQLFATSASIILLIMACHTNKKATSQPTPVANETVNTNTVSTLPNSNSDPFAAGETEVKAIQPRFPDVTAAVLKEGQRIYTGPCVKCHNESKMKLYTRTEESWQKAIDHMAPKAGITDVEKDALWKYVLAMRASHSNGSK